MSKGSSQRPRSVSQQEYDARWDAIFARDEHTHDVEPAQSSTIQVPESLPNTKDENGSN